MEYTFINEQLYVILLVVFGQVVLSICICVFTTAVNQISLSGQMNYWTELNWSDGSDVQQPASSLLSLPEERARNLPLRKASACDINTEVSNASVAKLRFSVEFTYNVDMHTLRRPCGYQLKGSQ